MTKRERKVKLSDKKKAREEFEKKQYAKRHEAIPIDKKKYKDKEKVGEVLDKENAPEPEPES